MIARKYLQSNGRGPSACIKWCITLDNLRRYSGYHISTRSIFVILPNQNLYISLYSVKNSPLVIFFWINVFIGTHFSSNSVLPMFCRFKSILFEKNKLTRAFSPYCMFGTCFLISRYYPLIRKKSFTSISLASWSYPAYTSSYGYCNTTILNFASTYWLILETIKILLVRFAWNKRSYWLE